jgi:hypothetical protein
MASAFHRVSDRMRCSTARSPGPRASRSGGMVFRYGVLDEYGTGAPRRHLVEPVS